MCSLCFRVTSRTSPKWRTCSQAVKCNVFSASSPNHPPTHPGKVFGVWFFSVPPSLCLLLSPLPGQSHRRAASTQHIIILKVEILNYAENKTSSNSSIKSYGRLLRSPSGWSYAMFPVPKREFEFFWGWGGWDLGECDDMIHLFVSFEGSLPLCFGVTEWKFCPKNDLLMFICSKSS